MKVCKKHLKLVADGTTYQLVDSDECIVCKNPRITRVGEIW